MIAGIKTAAEAKADATVKQQIASAPNSIGDKAYALLEDLMRWQSRNPTALSWTPNVGQNVYLPTQAIATIQNTWGYVLTTVAIVGKPPDYSPSGPIANWVRVTKVDWSA